MNGNWFLFIALGAVMIAVVVALIRGIIAFLQESHAQARGETGPSASSVQSNKMMQARIFFQAIAVLIIVIILFANGRT